MLMLMLTHDAHGHDALFEFDYVWIVVWVWDKYIYVNHRTARTHLVRSII